MRSRHPTWAHHGILILLTLSEDAVARLLAKPHFLIHHLQLQAAASEDETWILLLCPGPQSGAGNLGPSPSRFDWTVYSVKRPLLVKVTGNFEIDHSHQLVQCLDRLAGPFLPPKPLRTQRELVF